ncbi:single-stranded DNA-binding protein [Malaciobacter molluscorum LMG 25693]|uniref:Single-stranded DNA-binding protein n=1 Tax=Malaciobacter molluscorum LMG 25693 TaxID=870501 RepID=A0A2G1DH23_9BACT|nr:single-stranded DNA-binding protein [Malaciobacter molluscorum]AXX93399.1 single-stranded DNA binding protein [Malaciobacter molluscorum LMG 25693]PHO17802.1 single-stranded DNA-binding protein [Malaciobacter molluscorum LMG 25693]RXJ95082.1 single-stranded DNA-binding protein [Malaciobacter molluscorum]
MYNKIVMVGNLTRDIELRYLPSGAAIAKSAIATSYRYKTSTGEQKEEVCFLDFNIFGRSAEVANQYLRKGSKVLLEGRLVLEQWTAQDGTNRSKHSLRVDTMKMLDTKSDAQSMQSNGMDNGYNNNYSQPQQNQYNAPSNPQNDYGQKNNYGGMNSQAQAAEHKIPEIDIDEDEIPF